MLQYALFDFEIVKLADAICLCIYIICSGVDSVCI